MVAFIAILLSLLFPPTVALLQQEKTDEKRADVYQHIPQEQRELLRQAVEKLIAAEKKADWKSVYQLLDKKPGETEDSFLKETKRMRLLREFLASKVTFIPPDNSWVIQGCALFEGDPKQHGHVADITARWIESRWYLSPVVFAMFEKGKVRECSTPQAKVTSTMPEDATSEPALSTPARTTR